MELKVKLKNGGTPEKERGAYAKHVTVMSKDHKQMGGTRIHKEGESR